MRNDIVTVSLIEATGQTGICPLCKLWQAEEAMYIENLIKSDMIKTQDLSSEIPKASNLCNRHMHEILRVTGRSSGRNSDVGLVRFIADALKTIRKDLQEGLAMLGSKTSKPSLQGINHTLFEPEGSCTVCAGIVSVHRIHCAPFLEFLDDREYLKLYKAGPGVCMRHFRFILERADYYSELTLSGLRNLFELQKEHVEDLLKLCSEYVKGDGMHKMTPEFETKIKSLTLMKIAGLRGLNLE